MDITLNSTSEAYVASQVIKPKPGVLLGLTGYNSKASAQFIQVFDSQVLPAEGAIPKILIAVAASSPFSIDYTQIGRSFKNGIFVCNSSTGPTKTIGSADCWFDAQYQ